MRLLVLLLTLAATKAAAWEEPARGTEARRALLNVIRPLAEADLSPPIEFVITSLRVAGDLGFATLQPQRPGGAPILWKETRLAAKGEEAHWYDGTTIHALYQRIDGAWIVHDWSIGATDVWWSAPEACAISTSLRAIEVAYPCPSKSG